jgi:hypothetical protein
MIIRPLVAFGLLILPGCSVVMALSGKPEPRFELLQVGMSRERAETILGSPAEVATTKDGNQIALYIYERGNERSVTRAMIHSVLDVLTIGLWELPASVVELKQGEEVRFPIVYGRDETILLLNDYGIASTHP